ncbi:MAG: hypothetical protein IJ527_07470 [Prevotella sp.]|nr:hypothetical protein [Prevotella sp.]
MKKIIIFAFLCISNIPLFAQDMANSLIEKAIKDGIVLLRQDFQVLNEDDEPIGNKPGQDCYGRTYTCAARIEGNRFLVIKDFVAPWSNESIVKSEKRHPEVSFSGLLTLSTIDFEQFDCYVESASEEIANHLYFIDGSEIEGFSIDEEAGKKKGYAVWLKSATVPTINTLPTNLSIEILPFNITTKEDTFVYDIAAQPKGNVVGGVYITPAVNGVGSISLKVNGMFEKRGGVWKFISLGKENSNE